MAKPNYSFAKRQREIAKKQKKELKRQQKTETQPETDQVDTTSPSSEETTGD